jgi:hypothetical protein
MEKLTMNYKLSPSERRTQVALGIRQNKSNRAIEKELGVDEGTVRRDWKFLATLNISVPSQEDRRLRNRSKNGAAGDEAMAEVFTAAHAPTARAGKNAAATETKFAVASTPKPAVPPLTADEAEIHTGKLLETCLRWILRYVAMSENQAVILAAWILHT